MTERPIIFSGPMVRAILDGRKTVTRRVLNPQPPVGFLPFMRGLFWTFTPEGKRGPGVDGWEIRSMCRAGDQLWVRETMEIDGYLDLYYTADDIAVDVDGMPTDWRYREPEWTGKIPAIHMPRWACRLVLEVTAVRVERLQNISEADALAEGLRVYKCRDGDYPCYAIDDKPGWTDARFAFEVLWNRLNAKRGYGWDKNPWVLVVSFKRLDGPTATGVSAR